MTIIKKLFSILNELSVNKKETMRRLELETDIDEQLQYSKINLLTAAAGTQNIVEGMLEKMHFQISDATRKIEYVARAINDALVTTDLKGTIETFNQGAERIFGYDAQEVIGKCVSILMPEEYAHAHSHFMSKYVSSTHMNDREVVHPKEMRGKRKNGEVFPLEIKVSKIEFSNSVGFLALISDITDRKEKEKRIAEAEEKFRYFYNNTPILMHSLNNRSEIQSVSDYWLEQLGYSRQEVIGKKIKNFMTEKSISDTKEIYEPYFKKYGYIRNAPMEAIKKNGEILDVLVSAISERDSVGNIRGMLVVMTNVSSEKFIMKELSEIKDRYRDIVDSHSFMICRYALDGKLLFGNPMFCELFNINPNDINKYNYFSLLGEQEELRRDFLSKLNKDNVIGDLTHKIEILDKQYWIAWNDRLVVDDKHNAVEYQSIGQNVTEQFKLELAIRKSRTKYQSLVDNMTDGVFMIEKEKIISCNYSVANALGYTPQEFIGKHISELVEEKDLPKVLDYHKRRLAGDLTVPKEYIIHGLHKNGTVKTILVNVDAIEIPKIEEDDISHITSNSGSITSIKKESVEIVKVVLGTSKDLTDFENKENMLYMLTSVIDKSEDRIMVTDENGNILFANNALANAYGYSNSELIGANPKMFQSGHTDKDYYKDMWNTIKSGGIWHAPIINKTKHGDIIEEDMRIVPILTDDKPKYFLVFKKPLPNP